MSLQVGYRISIDLDLFSQNRFDQNGMLDYLESEKMFRADFIDKNTLKGEIENVKVDLITHSYPLVNDLIIMEDIRMASLEDIAAMSSKLAIRISSIIIKSFTSG